MQFIYGLLTAAVFFLCLLFFFYLGTRYAKQKPPDKEVDESTIHKQAKLQENFMKLMQYDVAQATARKKVT
ncbi:hypothetical protein QNH20_18345 [Neobacillus sp. WH10]|uniref:hypothetical protein n=1 Tax=Neobacillus sp. WH10 TaxID=3047873 RepID=UPI0024C19517|nr:hypothetical protein [Neobacillus sp. WH10]WHY76073.1 hypothetical protein QNH20_18345 [Neobacillus sp. WH10]